MTTILPLVNIGIDGFRGLGKLELGSLGRVNVLVGGNNSGKTSILEAISILADPAHPAAWMDMIRWRDPGRIDESRLHSFRWCFYRDLSKSSEIDEFWGGSCSFSAEGNYSLRRLDVNYQEIAGQPSSDELKNLYPDLYSSNAGLKEFLKLKSPNGQVSASNELKGGEIEHSIETASGVFHTDVYRIWDGADTWRRASRLSSQVPKLRCGVLAAYSYQNNIHQTSALSAAIDLTDEPSLVSLLQQFDPDVQDVDIRSTMGLRPAIYLKHARLGLAPLSIFGDAMRRAVLLASTLSSLPAGGVLLMDEAEAGIHIGAQQRFFAWILQVAKQRQVQVFMTTHSLEALDALLMAMPCEAADDDVVVFQLHRHQVQEPVSDQVQVKRFAGDLLHRLRFERGLDVR